MSRNLRLPTSSGIPKSSLSTQDQTLIDSCLKSLRTASRKIRPLHEAFEDDLRILERLYYKGKNQHHSSLFWRNVVEVRRIGQRISECRLSSLVDLLRLGFYDILPETSQKSRTKTLKGAWTCVPTLPFIAALLVRFRDIANLLNKTLEVTQRGYQAFVFSMQNTAFLTQAVALMAITARAHYVVHGTREVLNAVWAEGLTFMRIIEAEAIKKYRLPEHLPPPPMDIETTIPLPPTIGQTKTALEDVGQVVTSGVERPNETSQDKREAIPLVLLDDEDLVVTPIMPEVLDNSTSETAYDGRGQANSSPPPVAEPLARLQPHLLDLPEYDSIFGAVQELNTTSLAATTTIIQKRGSPASETIKKPKKRKKVKRDEIDDIFG